MNWSLELHGSEVQLTTVNGTGWCLRFSAALVRRKGSARENAGHVKGLELRFTEVQAHGGDPALCMGALSDSTLVIDGVRHRHLPLPFDAVGDVRAELDFRAGTTLILSARSVHCAAPGEADFRPSYAC